ncbi:MAG: T9SS type A sorting domain-containing protein [Flavobacteriales bacterium]|nr:T9SS type A sorting domain-containing protein [Flavobacteriales bacterium]
MTLATGAYTFEATFNGQEYSRPFTIGMPIGVDENEASATFSLSPNPAGAVLRIIGLTEGHGVASAFLYDATGRLTLNERVSAPSAELDVSRLPQGMYQLRIDAGGQTQARRVVIAR